MAKVGTVLHDAILGKFEMAPRGRVLDIGAESGHLAKALVELGFQAEACDCFVEPEWKLRDSVPYRQCDLNRGLPYPNESFDYVVCLEVIEHLDDPFALCRELGRVLRPQGNLYISTLNILSLRSRVKFLLDGSFLYFDVPPIEWEQQKGRPHVHVHPIRYHELEYYLYRASLPVSEVFTNMRSMGWKRARPLLWAIQLYAQHQIKRSQRKGDPCLRRIYAHVLSEDVLYGTHLIVRAQRAPWGKND